MPDPWYQSAPWIRFADTLDSFEKAVENFQDTLDRSNQSLDQEKHDSLTRSTVASQSTDAVRR